MLNMNIKPDINSIAYLQYMEEQEKKNDNGKQNNNRGETAPPNAENRK